MELVIFIIILGLIFDYTNGFHDAATVVSTVIASKALRPLIAILFAAILNGLGAAHIGNVAKTMTTGLVELDVISQLGILSALVGAIIWNLITWYFGIPSSSSYALIGGLIGSTMIRTGGAGIIWSGLLLYVIIPMVLSPLIGFAFAFVVMRLAKWFSRGKELRKQFRVCQIVSASAVAVAHGLNDAQKSMGIITLGLFSAGWIPFPAIPLWIVVLCAVVMGLGTAAGGYRIIRTVGFQITKINSMEGFSAETSASAVILAASYFGMPISSTHMIVGSVTGVGFAKHFKAVKWELANRIIGAWFFTLPGAAVIGAGVYKMLSAFGLE